MKGVDEFFANHEDYIKQACARARKNLRPCLHAAKREAIRMKRSDGKDYAVFFCYGRYNAANHNHVIPSLISWTTKRIEK